MSQQERQSLLWVQQPSYAINPTHYLYALAAANMRVAVKVNSGDFDFVDTPEKLLAFIFGLGNP